VLRSSYSHRPLASRRLCRPPLLRPSACETVTTIGLAVAVAYRRSFDLPKRSFGTKNCNVERALGADDAKVHSQCNGVRGVAGAEFSGGAGEMTAHGGLADPHAGAGLFAAQAFGGEAERLELAAGQSVGAVPLVIVKVERMASRIAWSVGGTLRPLSKETSMKFFASP
jgi:hypothetical protein